jgi:hypothetical protein
MLPPPTPTEWVAPGPDTLLNAMEELDIRLTWAESLSHAGARWQNQRQPNDRTCDGGAAAYFHFAESWQKAAQRARVQRDRASWLWDAPTLETVHTAELGQELDALQARTEQVERTWMVFVAWHERFGPRCSTVPPIRAITPAGMSVSDLHAIWLVEGVLCPVRSEETGVHLVTGPVCAAENFDCACTPIATAPGSVISK